MNRLPSIHVPQNVLQLPANGHDTAIGGFAVVPILGVPFRPTSYDAARCALAERLRAHEVTHLVLANAHTVTLATTAPEYARVLQGATLVLRDGVGVELAMRLRGVPPGDNFVGTDFVPRLLADLAPLTVFLVGAAPGVGQEAAARLETVAPGTRVVGVVDGYRELAGAAERVRAASPDVVLVALGNPLQEQWLDRHLPRLAALLGIGVGALFDYLAGRVRRAPRLLLRLHSEWVFRLLVEPRRLARRYIVGNPRFLYRVACELPRAARP